MALFDFFRRTDISDRQEAAVMKTLQSIRTQRRNRSDGGQHRSGGLQISGSHGATIAQRERA